MKKIYFTIAGTRHKEGTEFMERGDIVRLEKEPDNKHDSEAIKVLMDGIGHVGYVANSSYTCIGESYSAGRIYDKIGDEATGIIRYIMPYAAVCELNTDCLSENYRTIEV